VASLNRPGGNATGVSVITTELGPKRLGLLREVMPKSGLIAFVVKSVKAAAQSVAQPLVVVPAGTEGQFDEAFATMAQRNVAGIVYGATQLFSGGQRQAHRALAKHAIPADYEWRAFVRAGGLMSSSTKNRARPAMRASSRAQIRPICGTRTLRKKRYR